MAGGPAAPVRQETMLSSDQPRAIMSRKSGRASADLAADLPPFLLFGVYRPVLGANHLIH